MGRLTGLFLFIILINPLINTFGVRQTRLLQLCLGCKQRKEQNMDNGNINQNGNMIVIKDLVKKYGDIRAVNG